MFSAFHTHETLKNMGMPGYQASWVSIHVLRFRSEELIAG